MEPLPWYRILASVGVFLGLVLYTWFLPSLRFQALVLGSLIMVGYAMLQDQISVRLCPEYFTIFHQPIPGLTDPTLTGVVWGFLGSWWGGAIMGYIAGLSATLGSKPPLPLKTIVQGMLIVMLITGCVTALAGYATYRHAEMLGVSFNPEAMQGVALEHQRNILIVANYHLVAYGSSILGSVVLSLELARRRQHLA